MLIKDETGDRCRLLGPILLLLLVVLAQWRSSRAATISVTPEADTFVRSSAPASNYGGAGAISVSGAAAVNANHQQTGLSDSLIRFPMSNVVASLDTGLGAHDWIVLRAALHLTEMANPPSPIFNRGVGAFEIRWIAVDDWIEGTGIPVTPTTDGVAWQDLPFLLNPATDVSLGQFTNSGIDSALAFELALKEPFLSDLRSGTRVTLYLTAASPQIGFTADSRSFVLLSALPSLEIVAAPNPHPQIDRIELLSTNVSVSFGMVSNWVYKLECSPGLAAPGPVNWSNLLTVPAQPGASNVVFLEPATNRQKFYRLSISP